MYHPASDAGLSSRVRSGRLLVLHGQSALPTVLRRLSRKRNPASRVRHINPTGKISSDIRKSCQVQNFRKSKIFDFPFTPNHLHINSHPVPLRGASAVVMTRGGDAVDVDVAIDGRSKGVRRKRVVLAPVTASSLSGANASGGDGGNRGRLTGESAS